MEERILRTLAYHDIFDFPLSFEEIWRLLISSSKFKVQSSKLQLKVKSLIKKKKIEEKEGFYFLGGRREIVGLRKKRERYSRKKLSIAKRIVRWLRLMPMVKMLGVTGAVAVGNARKEDDIDLLIVTVPQRLWLTRLVTVLLIEVLRKRRRPADKKVKDKICLNIFLEENHLRMPKEKRNLFVAHEVVQMRPIFSRDNTFERFLEANDWARRYLPNAIKVQSSKFKVQSYPVKLAVASNGADSLKFKSKDTFNNLIFFPLSIIEKMAYWCQLRYMKKRMTCEQVSPYWAFFHPEEVSKKVLRKYKRKVKSLVASEVRETGS